MKKLLLVDDEESMLFALGRYFSRAGYEVQTARALGEAEALTKATEYDLVILDIALTEGGEEGLELLRLLRPQEATRTIVLTADGSEETEAAALGRGADAFLEKPQPLADIAAVAANLLAEGV